MPILDLNGAKKLPGYRRGRRTLGDPGTLPPGANTYGYSGYGGRPSAGVVNRLSGDFIGSNVSADQEIYGSTLRLRARARQLGLDNALFNKFLAECVQNVIGEHGIQLQAKVTNDYGRQTADTKRINLRIEQEWKRWGKLGSCTADGGMSWVDLQQLAIRTIACEGEMLTKYVLGPQFNDSRFALQPLDNDQLDDNLMLASAGTGADSSEIRMGVEINGYGRPQAYHLFSGHPSDMNGRNRVRVRVDAEYINHTFIRRRPAQRRGYTWGAASLLELNHLYKYVEAVEVASRFSAAKFLVIQQAEAEGEDYTGEEVPSDGTDAGPDTYAQAAGSAPMSGNAGEAMVLDPGQTANFIDPRFPSNNHRDFMRTIIRNIATGLLVDYPTLGNDLEGVNFSSIRAGLLDVRDFWRLLQRWFTHHFVERIFRDWLKMALLTVLRDITLSPAQMDQMVWHARGWDWVDPLKDAQATVLKLQNGLTTYSKELAELGLDFEELMIQRAAEQKFIDALGITLGTDIRGIADTADDNQDPQAGGAAGGSRALHPSAAILRVLSVQQRTPQQIADAVETFRTAQLALPPPSESDE